MINLIKPVLSGMLLCVGCNVHSDTIDGQDRGLNEESSEIALPTTESINRIEEVLARDNCILTMQRWNRQYYFRVNAYTRELDRSKVDFVYRQAGRFGLKATREITTFEQAMVEIDDRDYLMAYGYYDISSDRVSLTRCGENIGLR